MQLKKEEAEHDAKDTEDINLNKQKRQQR